MRIQNWNELKHPNLVYLPTVHLTQLVYIFNQLLLLIINMRHIAHAQLAQRIGHYICLTWVIVDSHVKIHEKNKSTRDPKLDVVVYALNHWRHYLHGVY